MELSKSLYIVMFLTGLGGGFGHCIGMCGPVVAGYSLKVGSNGLKPHLLYNLGRIFTYTFLGASVGYAGSFVRLASGIEPLQKGIMLFAGVLIVVLGLSMTGFPSALLERLESNSLSATVGRIAVFLNQNISVGTLLPFGIVMGFLPCGLVYTSLLMVVRVSMDSSSHMLALLQGGAFMAVFGLGTLPSLLMFGRAIEFINQRFRKYLYRLSALIVVIMGGVFIYRALS